MVLLLYINDYLLFISSKGKIDKIYVSLQVNYKIEHDGDLRKYLEIDLDHRPDGSIHMRHPYQTLIILNMIPGMDKSSSNPNPLIKPPLAKNEGSQTREMILITDQ